MGWDAMWVVVYGGAKTFAHISVCIRDLRLRLRERGGGGIRRGEVLLHVRKHE